MPNDSEPLLSLRFQEPLSAHTAWRTGGAADAFVVAHDEEAVVRVLRDCKDAGWSVHVLGTGSRVLYREGGVQGVVLKLGSGFQSLRIVEGGLVRVDSAVPVPALLAFAATHGLAADQEHYVLCGTFGASLLADAWDVAEVRLARASGAKVLAGDRVGSRTNGVVLGATIRLEPVGRAEADARFLKALRRPTTPANAWMCAPKGNLRSILRKAQLDRVRLRQIAIPDEAPELLVNLGGGTARDLQLLHQSALERVKRVRGVTLTSTKKWAGSRP